MEKKIAVIEVASPPDKEKFSEAKNLLKTVPFLEFFFLLISCLMTGKEGQSNFQRSFYLVSLIICGL